MLGDGGCGGGGGVGGVCECGGDKLTFHVNRDPEEILQGKLCLN